MREGYIQDGVIKKKFHDYIWIKVGMKWVQEHHLAVEEQIGRMLEKGEVVHHLDFCKENNSINNLMLFKSQKEHASFHNKLRQFGLTNPIKRMIENRWKHI